MRYNRKRGSALPVGQRSVKRMLAVLVVLSVVPTAAFAQTERDDRKEPARGVALLQEVEGALAEVIERSERSVVSIFHTSASADQLTDMPSRRAGPLPINVRGRQIPIFNNGRQIDPRQLALGGLQEFQQTLSIPPQASGAGVLIDESGLVLTQYRVVKLDDTHVVTDVDGNRYFATIRAADPRSGLAILAIERSLETSENGDESFEESEETASKFKFDALPIGRAEELTKGRFVIAIGNPFSIESDGQPTASWGTITNTALKAPSDENLNDAQFVDGSYRTTLHHFGSLIQTDAKLGWNAAGGALVNLNGELVGIVTTAASIAGHEQPAGYAIPMNEAMRRAVATMREGLEPEYGLLGVNFQPNAALRNPQTGRRGVQVSGVFQGGPAQQAGLRVGDLLLSVDGEPLSTTEMLQLAVGSLPPGETYPVRYERGGRVEETTVKLGKAYIDEGQIVTRRPPAWRGIRVDFATAIPPQVLAERARDGYLNEEGCVVVTDVEDGSISYERGIRPYTYISHVNGERVTTPAEFYEAVKSAGNNVKLKFTKPLSEGDSADGN